MKKRYIIGLSIIILLVVIYVVSAFLIHKRVEKNTQLAIQQIEASSDTQIQAIHYRSLHVTPFSWLKHTVTFKDVVIDIKTLPTPILIDKLTLALPPVDQSQVPNKFSIRIVGLHLKSIKDVMEQIKAANLQIKNQLINFLTTAWPDTLNPKTDINIAFHDKRLIVDYRSYQNNATYTKGTTTLTQVTFNPLDSLNNGNLADEFKDAVIQSSELWINLPLTITQAQLRTAFPLAAGFLDTLGYSELDILFHLVSDYKGHKSHTDFTVDVKDAGKLSLEQSSTYRAPTPLFKLSCPAQQTSTAMLIHPGYPQIVNGLGVTKASLLFQNQGIVQRLLTLFAKKTNQSVDTLKAKITEGIRAAASQESEAPTIVATANALVSFINQPDNIQLSLNPPQPVSMSDFTQFHQCLNAMHEQYNSGKHTLLSQPLPNPVTQPVVYQTKHKALEKSLTALETQHEQAQNTLLKDLVAHTGFSIVANQTQS